MISRVRLSLVLSFFVLSLFLTYHVKAQEVGIDELSQMYGEEIIVTSTKRAQKVKESPSAITVITKEDLNQLGVFNIVDALNTAPGVYFGDVLSSFPLAGGIRGFHKTPANKVVLLVDGAPQMFEVYGFPSLIASPISIKDIERIEILRGPGSSLYGANAMFGVINIITKKPKDTQENIFSVTAGEQGTFLTEYIHSNSIDNRLFYRLSLGWEQQDHHGYVALGDDPAYKYVRYALNTDYIINDNSSLNIQGTYVDARRFYAAFESTGVVDFRNSDYYTAALTYTSKEPNITIKAYWDLKDLWDTGTNRSGRLLYFKMGTRGVDFQHSFNPFDNDILVWGANYVQTWVEGFTMNTLAGGAKRRHDAHGVFFDNTYSVSDKTKLYTGLRFDHYPNSGDTLSHRLSVTHQLNENHNLRFTWATSFRNPDFIESYYYNPGIPTVIGHESNNPEKAETFEIGWRGRLNKKLTGETNIFYTRVADLIWFMQTGAATLEHINIENFKQIGFETELRYIFTKWLSGILNYTYYEMWEEHQAFVNSSNADFLDMTPQHMLKLQLRAKFDNGFFATLAMRYMGSSIWRQYNWTGDPSGVTTVAGGKAEDYICVDLNLGYKFQLLNNEAQISVAAFNLFDKEYDDYPISTYSVGRTVVGSFTYNF